MMATEFKAMQLFHYPLCLTPGLMLCHRLKPANVEHWYSAPNSPCPNDRSALQTFDYTAPVNPHSSSYQCCLLTATPSNFAAFKSFNRKDIPQFLLAIFRFRSSGAESKCYYLFIVTFCNSTL